MDYTKVKINEVVSYSLKADDNITQADLYSITGYNVKTYIRQDDIEYTTIEILENASRELSKQLDKNPILHNNIERLEKWKRYIKEIITN